MKNSISILLLVSIALFTTSMKPAVTAYQPGDIATDFKLKNIDGKMLSLSDMKGAKGFIVTFTCNHCPFSVAYEDRIIALNNKYAPLGYPVVAINPNDAVQYPDDNFENMQQRAKEKSFNFPYLVDETQEIAKAYGAVRTPHVFILQYNEDGELMVEYIGAIDNNVKDASAATEHYAADAIDQLIADEEVRVKSTKAVGCTIKWKAE